MRLSHANPPAKATPRGSSSGWRCSMAGMRAVKGALSSSATPGSSRSTPETGNRRAGPAAGVVHHESPDRGVRPAKPPGDRPHRFTPLDRIPDLRPLSLREPPHLDAPPLLDLRLSHSTRCGGDPLSPPRNADISGRPHRGQTRALSAHVARPDPSGSAAIDREYTLSVVSAS